MLIKNESRTNAASWIQTLSLNLVSSSGLGSWIFLLIRISLALIPFYGYFIISFIIIILDNGSENTCLYSKVLKIRKLLSAELWCPNLCFGIWCEALYNLACYVCQPVLTLRHLFLLETMTMARTTGGDQQEHNHVNSWLCKKLSCGIVISIF